MNIDSNTRKKIISLIKSFLEGHEIIPFQKPEEWRSSANIIDNILRKNTKIFLSKNLSCDIQGDLVVFIILNSEDYVEPKGFDIFGDPLKQEEETFTSVHTVVITHTIQDKIFIEQHKRNLIDGVKKYIANICESNVRPNRNFQVYHIPQNEKKQYSIKISERIGALHYPIGNEDRQRLDKMGGIATNIYIAKLWDIVEMLNQLGDELFDKNVRYHVNEEINVEMELKKTLLEHPEKFFLYNNGIAIELMENDSLDGRKEHSIGITYKNENSISVINGAQTISAAADFFYQQDSAVGNRIAEAKEKAYVLCRVVYPEGKFTKKADIDSEMSKISIALNRQKPIKPTDIQYDCLQILHINNLYEMNKDNAELKPFLFYCMKRGERPLGLAHYELGELGRAVTAYYYNAPGDARSKAIAEIIRNDSLSEDGNEKDTAKHSIYAPVGDTGEFTGVFEQWYKPVNFAMTLIKMYEHAAKDKENGKINTENGKIILKNGKFFFVAWVINQINNASVGEDKKEKGFSCFPYGIIPEKEETKIIEYIFKFVGMVEKCATIFLKKKRSTLNSNDFKTDAFYEKWCDYARERNLDKDCIQYFEVLLKKENNS